MLSSLSSTRKHNRASAFRLRAQDAPHHHAIRLKVFAEKIRLASGVRESNLLVKANRPWIVLPHTETESAPPKRSRNALNFIHHLLRNSPPVPPLVNVEPEQLDR